MHSFIWFINILCYSNSMDFWYGWISRPSVFFLHNFVLAKVICPLRLSESWFALRLSRVLYGSEQTTLLTTHHSAWQSACSHHRRTRSTRLVVCSANTTLFCLALHSCYLFSNWRAVVWLVAWMLVGLVVGLLKVGRILSNDRAHWALCGWNVSRQK